MTRVATFPAILIASNMRGTRIFYVETLQRQLNLFILLLKYVLKVSR